MLKSLILNPKKKVFIVQNKVTKKKNSQTLGHTPPLSLSSFKSTNLKSDHDSVSAERNKLIVQSGMFMFFYIVKRFKFRKKKKEVFPSKKALDGY